MRTALARVVFVMTVTAAAMIDSTTKRESVGT